MTQVSTQEELRAALLVQETEIQIIADFNVSAQQNITYSLLLHSAPGAPVHTLSKAAGFSGALLRVSGGGSLTLENLILDGAAAGTYLENPANRTLVQAMGGSIHLGSGAVLQNNSSYQEGGGVYLSGDPSYVNTLLMDGNAVIQGCNSRTSGGGLTAALRNHADSVRLAGEALIQQNTAANGAGVYLRSYLAEVGGAISIGEQVKIRNNQATSNGGGIYCSSFSTGGEAPISLSLEENVEISSNHATNGGGVFFYSASPGDRLILRGLVHIEKNDATESGGGIYLSAPRDSALLSVQGATITDNHGANGGGLYFRATAGGTLEVTGQAVLNGNEATVAASGAGGGLWIQNVSRTLDLTFSNASLLGNQAATNGGGLFLGNSGNIRLHITGGSISSNTAGASGGGLYLNAGAGTLESTLDSCTVSGNTATANNGGGIWGGGSNNTLQIRNGTLITQNRSDAGNGGGVYFNGGRSQMSSGFIQTGGAIESNTASRGGGLYNDTNSTAFILGGTLQGNLSTQFAPGIYNAGALYTQGLRELANGLYIESRSAVAYLSNALAEGTVLQLENSSYLAPNPAGAPIVVGEATPQYPRLTQADANGFQKPLAGFEGWEIQLRSDNTQVLLAPAVYGIRYENTLGAQNPNPPDYTVLTPSITLLPLADTPGGRFLGWFDAPESGARVTEIPLGSTGNKILYAQWRAIPSICHTLTYCGNDGGDPSTQNVPEPITVPDGQLALISFCVPYRPCYRFTGWNTDPCGQGQTACPGQSFGPVTSDTYLYAQWKYSPPPRPRAI